MAFHIKHKSDSTNSNDKTFMTAGHCTHGNYDDPWHHHQDYKNEYGKIGGMKSTRYNSTKQRDVALVKIQDWGANKSTRMYGEPAWPDAKLTGHGTVVEDEELCTSLANSGSAPNGDKWWCGSADATHQWWKSTTAGIWVYGAAMDFPGQCSNPNCPSQPGDSGSPIFRVSNPCVPVCLKLRTAIGVVNAGFDDTPNQQENHSLYFAKVSWALGSNSWPNLKIYTGGQGSP
jgi:V8-like Glu-specific endopeptidase